jgi:hypothetical protein
MNQLKALVAIEVYHLDILAAAIAIEAWVKMQRCQIWGLERDDQVSFLNRWRQSSRLTNLFALLTWNTEINWKNIREECCSERHCLSSVHLFFMLFLSAAERAFTGVDLCQQRGISPGFNYCGRDWVKCYRAVHWRRKQNGSKGVCWGVDPWALLSVSTEYTVFRSVRKIAKATVSFVVSVRPHRTTRFPLNGFSWNFIFGYFSKICYGNSSFIKTWQE